MTSWTFMARFSGARKEHRRSPFRLKASTASRPRSGHLICSRERTDVIPTVFDATPCKLKAPAIRFLPAVEGMVEPADEGGAAVDGRARASTSATRWQPGPPASPVRAQLPHPVTRPNLGTTSSVLVLTALLGTLYGHVLRQLAWDWWIDDNYSHGFLVPLFSGYLIWQRRKELEALPATGTWVGLLALLAGIGMLVLGEVGAEF